MADTPHLHPISTFLVDEMAAALSDSEGLPFADLDSDVADGYRSFAHTVLEALQSGNLPSPDDVDVVLTEDQVSRILFCYDPSGTAHADIARLAHSHEYIRNQFRNHVNADRRDQQVAGRYLGELIWLIGYLAAQVPGATLLPARLASHVSGARAIYDPARYTVAIPISQTA